MYSFTCFKATSTTFSISFLACLISFLTTETTFSWKSSSFLLKLWIYNHLPGSASALCSPHPWFAPTFCSVLQSKCQLSYYWYLDSTLPIPKPCWSPPKCCSFLCCDSGWEVMYFCFFQICQKGKHGPQLIKVVGFYMKRGWLLERSCRSATMVLMGRK